MAKKSSIACVLEREISEGAEYSERNSTPPGGVQVAVRATTTPLRAILCALEIYPFSPQSVQKYKEEKLTEAVVARVGFWGKYPIAEKVFGNPMINVSMTLAAIMWFMLLISVSVPKTLNGILGCFILVTTVSVSYIVFRKAVGTVTWRKLIQWRRTSLEEYPTCLLSNSPPVPEFVARKTEQIQEQCPGVTFSVEYLDQDPFLIVSLGNEEYYVEVWGEPDFENKLFLPKAPALRI